MTLRELMLAIYACGYAGSREDAWAFVKAHPNEAKAFIARYHETAHPEDWGGMGTGNEAPKGKKK